MFRDLHITNFRGFREFHMEGLGRINLLVGPNNCGKTSVLEALDLLADYPDPVGLGNHCWRRGGLVAGDGGKDTSGARMALRHLFYGRQGKAGSAFAMVAQTETGPYRLAASLAPLSTSAQVKSGQPSSVAGRLVLQFKKDTPSETIEHSIPLTPQGEWPFADWHQRFDQLRESLRINFQESDPVDPRAVSLHLAKFALNPEEELVLQTLRMLPFE